MRYGPFRFRPNFARLALDAKDRAMLRILYMLPLAWAGLRLVWRLIRDRRVPPYLKSLPVLGILYALLPRDLMPDILPVIGWVDDLVVAAVLLLAFVLLALRAIAIDTVRRIARDARRPQDNDAPTIEGRSRHIEGTD